MGPLEGRYFFMLLDCFLYFDYRAIVKHSSMYVKDDADSEDDGSDDDGSDDEN